MLSLVDYLFTESKTDKTSAMSVVTYEEIEDLPNQPETLLVDVRDPPEIKDTGSIPTSINIPRKSPASRSTDLRLIIDATHFHCSGHTGGNAQIV